MTRPLPSIGLCLLLPACGVEELEAIIAGYDTFGTTDSSGDASTTGGDTGTSTSGVAGTSSGSSLDGSGTATMTGGADTSSDTSSGASSGETDDGTTAAPAPVCGDGVQEGDEECDDANAVEGDGCLNDCTKEWFVFITSKPASQGDLKGLVGVDYQCRHRAAKMFLPNFERYRAWISTSSEQAVDRLYHARGPYKLVNGLRVAASWDALLAGPLEHPINVTEMSETLNGAVFTGTRPDGTEAPLSSHCDDWTDNDGDNFAWYGDSTAIDQTWTFAIEAFCGGGAALYCFEQP